MGEGEWGAGVRKAMSGTVTSNGLGHCGHCSRGGLLVEVEDSHVHELDEKYILDSGETSRTIVSRERGAGGGGKQVCCEDFF